MASVKRTFCRILNIGPDAGVKRLLGAFAQSDRSVSIDYLETGTIALDLLTKLRKSELPDIVIIPFRLPILNGRDFIIEMRSQQELEAIPIFVWGSEIPGNEIDQLYRAGATCVFLGQFNSVHLNALRQFVSDSHVYEEETETGSLISCS